MDNLVINFAPTGMLIKKEDTPHIPVYPDEIVREVREALKLGISSVHLHARENQTQDPAWEKEIFEEIILKIREYAPELVISVTTSGRKYKEFEKRTDVLHLTGKARPDMASLTLSSLNFNKTASVNEPDMIRAILKEMNRNGIKPELEAFDTGMINYARYLISKGELKAPYYFNLILGNIACAQADLLHMGVMVRDLPGDSICAIAGIGRAQMSAAGVAIASGYGVRIGLEDNIWLDEERTRLATNLDYLEKVHNIREAMGRRMCSPAELRYKLCI